VIRGIDLPITANKMQLRGVLIVDASAGLSIMKITSEIDLLCVDKTANYRYTIIKGIKE